ncbi:MAG: NUDIX domain-containing protein [Hyphomicrobiales bacterium]|nr:MAG: NUDIX domain-containing protein [Hyphomicrobiales bacterium]
MTDKITLVDSKILSDEWGRLTQVTIDYRRDDGLVQRLSRENYDRGNAAAILLYNAERRTVLLVRQFRYPVLANGDPSFLLEVCAGLLDGDDPLTCARREAVEEMGHEPRDITAFGDIYMSPGSVQEKVSLFVGHYDEGTYRNFGGGLVEEGEELEVVEMGLDDAIAACSDGRIVDGKTVILLQHVRLGELTMDPAR